MLSDNKYIFWLYGANSTGRFLSTEDLIKCEISTESISVDSQPVRIIQPRSIQKCEVYTVGGSTFLRHMIKLKVVISDKFDNLFLFPANPLEPTNEKNNIAETNSLNELINGFLDGRDVTIDPNPYYRSESSHPWKNADLDANISPWVYYHRFRKKTSLTQVVFQIVVTIVVLIVLLILLAFFADYFL